MSLEVVRLTEDKHYQEAIRLGEYAFRYKIPEEKIAERIAIQKELHQVYGIFEEKTLVSKLHIIPYEIFFDDQKWKMGGIAGVATYPEFRRKGHVKELLRHALQVMNKDGYTVSVLHPFSVPFYRKYGWELLSNQLKSTLFKSDLIQQEETPGTIKRYSDTTKYDDLNTVYEAFASQHAGMLVRPPDLWTRVYEGYQVAVYFNTLSQPTGYLMYEIEDDNLKVKDFVPLNNEARRGLWNYICQHDSMIKQVEMITTEREPLFYSLHNPSIKSELIPYGMVRIVSAEAFLKQYPFCWDQVSEEITLQLEDTFAPWNNQTFLLKNRSVSVLTPSNISQANTIKLDINALSTVLFGYKRPNELQQIGAISGDEYLLERWEKMIPRSQSFIYDYF